MGKLLKGLSVAIGLATEAYAHRSRSRPGSDQDVIDQPSTVAHSPPADEPPSYSAAQEIRSATNGSMSDPQLKADKYAAETISENEEESDDDVVAWDLDDAQSYLIDSAGPPEYSDVDTIVQSFTSNHPTVESAATFPQAHLTMPVIIPQKRPGSKGRGFVRAYAPILADCGVEQSAFLDFLDSFSAATKVSPNFNVINIACFGAGFSPMGISQAITLAVSTANGANQARDGRNKTNNFLDTMNNTLFGPHGLYVMLVRYIPSSNLAIEAHDIDGLISTSNALKMGLRNHKPNLTYSNAPNRGNFQIAEAAPLVFPSLDALPQAELKKITTAKGFVEDYYDRRAQARYDAEHPDSRMSVLPQPEFASRYSDPNHAVNSGSLIALVTGGVIDPKGRKMSRRAAKIVGRYGDQAVESSSRSGQKQRGSRKGMLRKVLTGDVLYMMIVNRPSQVDLNAAAAELFQGQQEA